MAVDGRRVLHFTFRVIQLNAFQWENYQNVLNPVAAAFMAKMQMQRSEHARVKWACYDLTARLGLPEDKARIVLEFVEVHLPLNPAELAEFEVLFRAANPEIQEVVMKFSNQWVEKGWREGEQIGLRKGEALGLRKGEQIGLRKGEELGLRKGKQLGEEQGRHAQALEHLVRLLSQKVGPVPEETQAVLAGLPADTLSEMVVGIFTIQSFDDLRRWL
jgi:hypothetical protein